MSDLTVQEYSDMVALHRDILITEVIRLERLMDLYLAAHFCKEDDKREEIMRLIFTDKMMFSIKKDILFAVLKEHNKKFIEVQHPKFKSDIVKIMEARNVLAHRVVEWPDNAPIDYKPKELGFTEIPANNKFLFDKRAFDFLSKLIEKYISAFTKLIGLNK
jgi:hypothetical protein